MGLFSVSRTSCQDSNAGQIHMGINRQRMGSARARGWWSESGFLISNKRHFIPTTSVEFTSNARWCSTAPLLEEEWDISGSTGYREYGEPIVDPIGRKFGPDSPPAIAINRTRFIPSGPSNGSQEKEPYCCGGACRGVLDAAERRRHFPPTPHPNVQAECLQLVSGRRSL